MDWIAYIVASIFTLAALACVASIIVSLPGTWIMLALAVVIELADTLYLPESRTQTFSWEVLGICFGLALLGELLELVAGAAGAKAGGAGKRGMIGALIGGIGGAIAMTFLLPIPIVGTLVGALAGTFVGAVVGEVSGAAPRTVAGSVKPAIGATIGRLGGTFAKMLLAIAIWAALTVAAFVV